jgi:hypothetical protein
MLTIGLSAPTAQEPDDLARLLPQQSVGPMNISMEDGRVDEVLALMAEIGGFEVYFTLDVAEWPPISVEFDQVEYESILRALLTEPGVRYRVVDDDALLVSHS